LCLGFRVLKGFSGGKRWKFKDGNMWTWASNL
jgi:hypothetical protein